MLDFIEEWLVDLFKAKRGHDKGQLWNAETKTFESVKDFLARQGDRNAS